MRGRLVHQFLSYQLDPALMMLFKDGTPIQIAPKTFKLLYLFVMHYRTALTIDDVMTELYGSTNVKIFDYAVARQIADLRKVLDKDKEIIKTTKGRVNRQTGERIPTRYYFDADVKLIQILPLSQEALLKPANEEKPLRRSPESDKEPASKQITEADELFALGRYHWLKSIPSGLYQAIKYFNNVIAIDPAYAEAHTAIADCWILLSVYAHQSEPPKVAMPKALKAASRALSINPDIPAAHYSIATYEALYKWNWQQAKNRFETAITLDPLNPMLKAWYALCLSYRLEHMHAKEMIKLATEMIKIFPLNPMHYLLAALCGRIYYMAREFELALKESLRSVRMDEFYLGHIFAGHTYRELGQYKEALNSFEKAFIQAPNNPIVWAEIGHIYGRQGKLRKAQEVLNRLQQFGRSQRVHISPHLKAHVYLGLGEIDETLNYLEESYDQRDAYMVCLTVDPVYTPLYKEPRFDNLIKRVGFLDYSSWQDISANHFLQ